MRTGKCLAVLCGGKIVAVLSLAAANVAAQTAATNAISTAAPDASKLASGGLGNDWLRAQNSAFDPLDLGGQFRPRYVGQSYFAVPGAGPTAVDFRADTPHSQNDFLLLRT